MLCFSLANEAEREAESGPPDFGRTYSRADTTLSGMRNDYSFIKRPGPSLQIYLGDA
jgi:hypothetical protein